MLLLRTVHGSRLYGLHHKDSDYDWFEVYANAPRHKAKFIKQKIVGADDTVRMNLSTFMLYADRSAHQTLDAVFSRQCEVNLIQDLCDRFVVNRNTMVPLYMRTIKSFWNMDTEKHQRHAVRLALQLEEALTRGRFDPTLSSNTAKQLLAMDEQSLFDELWYILHRLEF